MTAVTQTVIIWDQMGENDLGWLVVEGDHSHLNYKYTNSTATSDEDAYALSVLMFDSTSGETKPLNYDFNAMPHGEGTKIIVAGYIP